jgi:chemotaxis protein methyltransferase CheR
MKPSSSAPRDITGDEFRFISELLHQRTGIRLVPGKEILVMGRLNKRLRHYGLRSYGEYIQMLRRPEHAGEVRQAIDLLTTNETFFFREPQHFDFLRQVVVPARTPGRPFRLWSAASSSGEEAYTAAMVLAEAAPSAPWEIIGTDVSTRVVESARRGVYPITAADRIPPPLLRKHCLRGRDEYDGLMAMSRELRARVSFVCANLLDDLGHLGRFDVILLRNVMIYFDGDTKIDLIARLREMLQPRGYLIIGLSETLNGISSDLHAVKPSIYELVGADRA